MLSKPIAKPSVDYFDITHTLKVSIPISVLSPEAKVQLFRQLGEELGIWERFHAEPDATKRAQEIITEQWDKHWIWSKP